MPTTLNDQSDPLTKTKKPRDMFALVLAAVVIGILLAALVRPFAGYLFDWLAYR